MTKVQKLAKVMVLKDMFKEYELLAKYNGGVDYDRWKALEMAIQELSQEPTGHWIPVSKKLPDDNQEVQITYKINGKYYVWSAIWDELHCRFYDKEYRGYLSVDYVTAWMPLPEPYKEGEVE